MTGINVLSTGVSPKSKEEGFSFSEKAQTSMDSEVIDFAAILGGWVAQMSGQGQNSGFQSNEPAGKEANSGRNAILGLDGLQVMIGTLQGYGNPQEVLGDEVQGRQAQTLMGWTKGQKSEAPAGENTLEALLAQLKNLQNSTAPSNPIGNIGEAYRSGMMTEQPQGKNSPKSELDLYKGVISELLKDMSGEIKAKTMIDPEALNTSTQQRLLLAVQRMNSGLFDEFTNEKQSQLESILFSQLVSESGRNAVPSDASNQEDDVLPSNRFPQEFNFPKIKQDSNVNLNSVSVIQASQGELTSADQQATASLDIEQRRTQENNSVAHHPGRENQDSVVLQKQESTQTKISKNEALGSVQPSTLKGVFFKEIQQENKASTQRLSAEEANAQDSVTNGFGISGQVKENAQLQAKVENKAELPIWAQVARDIQEKAFQARPHIRELDIQLHPAELGQVRLSLRWEDGQVHLRMTASESGTGQMLQSNFSELRENLSQLGIQCGMLEMSLGDQQRNTRDQQGQEASNQARGNQEEPLEVQNSYESDTLSGTGLHESKEISNRINVTA